MTPPERIPLGRLPCYRSPNSHIPGREAAMPKLFTRNEGTVDRALRVIVGLGLISLVFVGPKTMWGWIGIIPLVTGFTGSCLAYNLFGWDTRSPKEKTGN